MLPAARALAALRCGGVCLRRGRLGAARAAPPRPPRTPMPLRRAACADAAAPAEAQPSPRSRRDAERAASGAGASATSSPPSLPPSPPRGARHNERDAADTRHDCPCCSNQIRGRTVRDHLHKCAPDVLDFILAQGAWPATPAAALALAAEGEAAALRRLKTLRYGSEALDWADAAARFGPRVTQQRLRGILRRDSVRIPLVQDPEPLEVIFEDDELLAVCKPPDLRVHPIHRFQGGSLLNRAATHCAGVVPFIVHRLDQDTSGVTLLVKDHALTAPISAQFADKQVAKEYLAVCVGVPPAKRFLVNAPIARHPTHAPARQIGDGAGLDGKHATTTCTVQAFRPAAPGRPAACVVRAAPATGRTHQIRLHLAAAGVPIIADTFYGPPTADVAAAAGRAAAAEALIGRQALHAAALSLTHPRTGAALRFEARMADDMAAAAEALGVGVAADVAALEGLPDWAELVWANGTTLPVRHAYPLQ